MMFLPLASSSAGNAYLLDDGHTRLLIECGLTHKKLQKLSGFGLAGISGCLLSHEHKDHAKCYKDILKAGIPIYTSEGTAEALDCAEMTTIEPFTEVTVGTFDIKPFPVFHDAAEPFGFLIRSCIDGEKLMFATDTVNLGYRFPRLDYIALETNYDKAILARSEKLPDKVKSRIQNNHMEIGTALEYLSKVGLSACKHVFLLHLSDACSNEQSFLRAAQAVCKGVPVTICPKEKG